MCKFRISNGLKQFKRAKKQFMSDQDIVFSGKRRANRLNVDSEEEERILAEAKTREDEHRQRKEDRRIRRQEQARFEEEEAQKRLEQQIKYQKAETMLLEDSDSNDGYERVERKIRKAYPQFRGQEESTKRRHHTESEQQQSSSSDQQSQEVVEKQTKSKKAKIQRMQMREEEDKQNNRQSKQAVVKVEELDPKEKLVREVAIRWWYCLPEWPPSNFPYEQQLAKLGYRLVNQNCFKMSQNIINGMTKVSTVDGYVGIFRAKHKIIDLRPKKTVPSLRLLRSKTIEELTELLKVGLKAQIIQLNEQKYHQVEELQLLETIQRRHLEIC